jgi:hypothetical protein
LDTPPGRAASEPVCGQSVERHFERAHAPLPLAQCINESGDVLTARDDSLNEPLLRFLRLFQRDFVLGNS